MTLAAMAGPDDLGEELMARLEQRLEELRDEPLPLLDPAPAGRYQVASAMPPQHYEAAVASGAVPVSRSRIMSRDDRVRKDVINALMCHGVVDTAAVGILHAIDFDEYFEAEMQRLLELQGDGLVDVGPGQIALTPVGRLLMRTVAMTFDAYVGAQSRTVAMSRVI